MELLGALAVLLGTSRNKKLLGTRTLDHRFHTIRLTLESEKHLFYTLSRSLSLSFSSRADKKPVCYQLFRFGFPTGQSQNLVLHFPSRLLSGIVWQKADKAI